MLLSHPAEGANRTGVEGFPETGRGSDEGLKNSLVIHRIHWDHGGKSRSQGRNVELGNLLQKQQFPPPPSNTTDQNQGSN